MSGKRTDPPSGLAHSQRRTIVLIGLRGSGKTTVGRILADLLDGQCIDADEVIQREAGRQTRRACRSISEIFKLEGEEGFRRREREVIAKIALSPPAVVSVGGGAVLDEANAEVLTKIATVVWLTAPAQVLWERISADPKTAGSRPSLTDLSGVAELEQLATQRFESYERLASQVIDTEGLSPSQVAQAILENLGDT